MKKKNNSFYIDNYNKDKYCKLTPISEIFKNFKPKELKLKPTDLNKNLIQLINQRNKDFVKIYKKTILFEENKVSNNLIINKNKKLKKHHYFPSDNYTNILKKETNNNLIENIKPIKNNNNYEEKTIKNNISISFTNFDNKNKKNFKKNNEEIKSNFINKQNNDKFFLTSFNQYKNNLLSNSNSLYLKKNIKLSLKKNNHRSRNIKNINSKDNSNNDNFLSADNKSFKSLSDLFFNSNINKYHTKNNSNENISVSDELKNLENVNNKTQYKLNKIVNKWFYIPLLTPSFENDVKDIINKKFLLNNGQYKLESLDKLNIKDTIKNYWKYKNFKHNIFYSLQYKNNGMIQNLESKIKKDLIRCESRKIEIKFGTIKNNKIFERLLQKNTKPIHLRKIDKSLLLNKNINSNLTKYSKTFEKFYKSQ